MRSEITPMAIFAVLVFALYVTFGGLVHSSSSESQSSSETSPSTSSSSDGSSSCITFDDSERMITITCKTTNLTYIDNQLKAPDILHRDEAVDKGWVLNAGITIAEGAALYINSSDTSWLKIIGDGETAYPILVSGSMKIDSVKISSWDPNTNNYTSSLDSDRDGQDVQIGTPRPYIVVDSATGTTDIINSEIAYLGYESGYGGGRTGLRYEGGDGSIIRGSNIHDLYFGFYSKGVGDMTLENNHIHNNIHYGLDPHTVTHDMTIKNNTVHDNGSIGIICSLDCYNITIENNTVYNNTKMGIMFSRNMTDSIARNNDVSNEDRGIVMSESSNNEVYNNTITNSGSGIDVDEDSFDNNIHDNTIADIAEEALGIEEGAEEQNTIHSNILVNNTNNNINNSTNNNTNNDDDHDDQDSS
ncbi:MAG: right-handed parallel beta-helix repeat-containing protein [Nitrososphaeraceae archaeon]